MRQSGSEKSAKDSSKVDNYYFKASNCLDIWREKVRIEFVTLKRNGS